MGQVVGGGTTKSGGKEGGDPMGPEVDVRGMEHVDFTCDGGEADAYDRIQGVPAVAESDDSRGMDDMA